MQVKAICVFCSSSESVDATYKEAAVELGRMMGHQQLELIFGGGTVGLMGCVARGVHETGGHVVGVIPHFFMNKNIDYGEADELIETRDMRERKMIMDQRADAFIVLPGGVGTLEEGMEILSLIQLKQTQKPLVFVNTNGFYGSLMAHFENMIQGQFAKRETLDLFYLAPDPESALAYITDFTPPNFQQER